MLKILYITDFSEKPAQQSMTLWPNIEDAIHKGWSESQPSGHRQPLTDSISTTIRSFQAAGLANITIAGQIEIPVKMLASHIDFHLQLQLWQSLPNQIVRVIDSSNNTTIDSILCKLYQVFGPNNSKHLRIVVLNEPGQLINLISPDKLTFKPKFLGLNHLMIPHDLLEIIRVTHFLSLYSTPTALQPFYRQKAGHFSQKNHFHGSFSQMFDSLSQNARTNPNGASAHTIREIQQALLYPKYLTMKRLLRLLSETVFWEKYSDDFEIILPPRPENNSTGVLSHFDDNDNL